MNRRPVRRALLSVADKRGLEAFASRLVAAGVEVVSSGGTAAALEAASVPVTKVADVTDAPEILGGRVKTLHPRIHGGILADRGSADHRSDLDDHGIDPFDLVVVNLYPFEATVARREVTEAEAIEKIDIGGPAMIRAAAKNHAWVGVVVSPDQYEMVAQAVEAGGLTADMRRSLAAQAFFRTAAYDSAILHWFESSDELPQHMVVPLERATGLRYGENPHQAAAVYREPSGTPWWGATRQLQGKEMSFNNYADAEAAWRLVSEFSLPAAVVVKHTNACGVAVAESLEPAFRDAWDCDPLSAFGGVVALNRMLDSATATAIAANFVEVVIAPAVDEGALDVLAGRKNLRVLEAPAPHGEDFDVRRLEDGFLVQQRDRLSFGLDATLPEGWELMTERAPSPNEVVDLVVAWLVAANTKSNAVVIAAQRAAVGIGAGDQSRVGAARRAVERAGTRAEGAAAASDAFFPFRDGLDLLADAGVVAVAEPGGSKRDTEVIEAAAERGMALVFTGRRHFRH